MEYIKNIYTNLLGYIFNTISFGYNLNNVIHTCSIFFNFKNNKINDEDNSYQTKYMKKINEIKTPCKYSHTSYFCNLIKKKKYNKKPYYSKLKTIPENKIYHHATNIKINFMDENLNNKIDSDWGWFIATDECDILKNK